MKNLFTISSVMMSILLGQEVATLVDGYMEASTLGHAVTWNAENLASGVYFISTQIGYNIENQKVTLVK